MGAATVSNVRLAGLASAVPPLRVVEWADLGVPVDRFPAERRIGRKPALRAARWEQCQSDFCLSAAESLLAALAWEKETIDVLVLVTLTPDYPIPATAIILQDRLGLKKGTLAFDLPGGEATFLHAWQLVASMLSAGFLRRGLLLCGGVSKVVEGPDNIGGADHICGHNGSVVALERAPGAAPMFFDSGGDGSAHESFYMPIGGTRRPPDPAMFSAADAIKAATHFTLDLAAVEAAARRELPASMRRVMTRAGREIDHCFFPPITLPTDDAVRRAIGLPRDRFHSFISELGPGGSGNLVLAMLARAAGSLSSGARTSLLAGMGAGFAWGSAIISTENVVCLEPLEMV